MWQEALHSHWFCKNKGVEEFWDKASSHQLLREVLDPVKKKPWNEKFATHVSDVCTATKEIEES